MKKGASIIISIFSFFLPWCSIHAQPDIEWQKAYGGDCDDWPKSVQLTNDRGYIVAGYSCSTDGDISNHHGTALYKFDYWVIKVDSTGELQWERSLGGTDDDKANCVLTTQDGGYIVVGGSSSSDCDVTVNWGSSDYWIVKLDSLGNILWEKSYGGSGYDMASSVAPTPDKGYIVVGYSRSQDGYVTGNHGLDDYWVIKLDSIGNLLWQKSLGGSQDDRGFSINVTLDGGYLVIGSSRSSNYDVAGNHGSFDYWVVKLSETGNIQWQKNYGGPGEEWCRSFVETDNGDFVIAGETTSWSGDVLSNHGLKDAWVLKIDNAGDIIWTRTYGGTENEWAQSVINANDTGYILTASTYSQNGDVTGNHGWMDIWMVSLDNAGLIKWQKCYGGTQNDDSFSNQQTLDGGYIVAGRVCSDDEDAIGNTHGYAYWLVKLFGPPEENIEENPENHCYLPNIFSPNLDGQNDVLFLRGENIAQFELVIYNRWGVEVFRSMSISNGWDGRFHDKDCPEGVFCYTLNVIYNDGSIIRKTGNVTLVR